MKSMGLRNPLNLSEARMYFESKQGQYLSSDFPQNLTVVGVLSGHRRSQIDPDFTQVYLELSQGLNEEFRLCYEGK